MGVVNRLLAGALPYAPDCLVRKIARPYIAGEDRDAALAKAATLRATGSGAMLNLLGEDDRDPATVKKTLDDYLAIAADGRVDLSVKPTQLGLGPGDAGYPACYQNLAALASTAKTHGRTLWIDMEDHTYTDATKSLVFALRANGHDTVGVALQARLKRTMDDLMHLSASLGCRVRLCKGIYLEPEGIAYTKQADIDEHSHALFEKAFERGAYVGMATHDEQLIAHGKRLLDTHGHGRGEFQMLLGVRPELAKGVVQEGYPLNSYVPYGPWEQARKYCERRIKKNPNIAGYVLKNIFSK